MRVLITGITGFAGSHLADYLLREQSDAEVFGVRRWRSRTENIAHIEGKLELLEGDMRDQASMLDVLERARPDFIFHLAAQSFVPTSWRAPAETLSTNVLGQTHLFEAVRALKLDSMIQIACSSEEYGLVHPDEVPITEDNPLRPLSPYAVSKVAQDLLGFQYFRSYGMKIVRTRGFNHTGPRRGEVFVVSNFARQLVAIETGAQEPKIRVGNLDAVRDFTDVRDVVRAYWLALEKGRPGEVYNIASGKGRTIREILDRLIELSGVEPEIEIDPTRLRPSDVEILIGDSSKFRADTGWETRYDFDRTLVDMLEHWRSVLGRAAAAGVPD